MSSRELAEARRAKILARSKSSKERQVITPEGNYQAGNEDESKNGNLDVDQMIDNALNDVLLLNNSLDAPAAAGNTGTEAQSSDLDRVDAEADILKQRREARRARILQSGSERLAMLSGNRIPSTAENQPATQTSATDVSAASLPPASSARGDAVPPKRDPQLKSSTSKGSAYLSSKPLNSDLIESSTQKVTGTFLRSIWFSVSSNLSSLFIILFGVGVGLVLIPTVRNATEGYYSLQSVDIISGSTRATLESFLSSSRIRDELREVRHPNDVFMAKMKAETGSTGTQVILAVLEFIDKKITGPLGYACVPLVFLTFVARMVAVALNGFLIHVLQFPQKKKQASSDSQGGFDPIAMITRVLPFIGHIQRALKTVKTVMSDTALMHAAVLVTLACGMLPLVMRRLTTSNDASEVGGVIDSIGEDTLESFSVVVEDSYETIEEVETVEATESFVLEDAHMDL